MQLSVDKLGKVAITVEENYWSLEKDYDKLTIVEQEGVFGTFISRKPVPAGTVLTNRKYWIPFSSLKEEIVLQFNEIVNEVRELEVSVDEKEAEIYKAIASIVAGGVALKQSFGNSEEFGISQKVLTESRDALQAQIDAIISDKATVSLAVSTSTFIVGERTFILTASTNTNAETIAIYQSNVGIAIGSGKTLVKEVTVNQATAGSIGYTAEFTFAGNNKRTANVTVYFVNKIYVGSGAVYTDITTDSYAVSARRSPAGTYNVTVEQNGQYIFFVIPATMSITKATLSGFDFPLESPVTETIDNVSYKVYKSSNTIDAGTYQIVIS
ncbi:MAG: hypothetical protein J6Y28_09695 [Acholeplasmatales bacterium]|nr:hypothetical protein [Methanobrevibacter sp.]MBP5446431.1 hypothetical protein [Acholeplasmatales bacterium]